jgi:ligand-binding SRPBCC domain-containing protein
MSWSFSKKSKSSFTFVKRVELSSDIETVFEYHTHDEAINRLIPPWSPLQVLKSNTDLKNETIAILRL